MSASCRHWRWNASGVTAICLSVRRSTSPTRPAGRVAELSAPEDHQETRRFPRRRIRHQAAVASHVRHRGQTRPGPHDPVTPPRRRRHPGLEETGGHGACGRRGRQRRHECVPGRVLVTACGGPTGMGRAGSAPSAAAGAPWGPSTSGSIAVKYLLAVSSAGQISRRTGEQRPESKGRHRTRLERENALVPATGKLGARCLVKSGSLSRTWGILDAWGPSLSRGTRKRRRRVASGQPHARGSSAAGQVSLAATIMSLRGRRAERFGARSGMVSRPVAGRSLSMVGWRVMDCCHLTCASSGQAEVRSAGDACH